MKNLEELKERCVKNGFKYAYGLFKKIVKPPHLIAFEQNSDNYSADNEVYYKKKSIQLDYTYEEKNIDEQEKIENIILKDVVWNKTEETYLSNEKIWQVSYFFEL